MNEDYKNNIKFLAGDIRRIAQKLNADTYRSFQETADFIRKISIWNASKNKICRAAIAHIRAAPARGYAVSV